MTDRERTTRFRRRTLREVEAIRFDGSESAMREISCWPGVTVANHAGVIEVATVFGRRFVRVGQWIFRDVVTDALRVFDHDDFMLEHEALLA